MSFYKKPSGVITQTTPSGVIQTDEYGHATNLSASQKTEYGTPTVEVIEQLKVQEHKDNQAFTQKPDVTPAQVAKRHENEMAQDDAKAKTVAASDTSWEQPAYKEKVMPETK